ncbi:hypothetical protein AMTR_s00227p00027200 [Amborella trichopoda]|uniref:Uncharacterized protein n=1 Tax=Amborella trichopoda TaxID=13333 RepID=W1NTU2_AMBTC|nr:hypothetical protein AMTR_s00227p00027200 [Amborella trichopoda]
MISDNRWDSSRSGTRCVKTRLQRMGDPYQGKPHDNHRSGKITYRFFSGNHSESSVKNYSCKVSYETNFSDEDSSNDSDELTGSDYKSSPNGVPSVKRDFQKKLRSFRVEALPHPWFRQEPTLLLSHASFTQELLL